MLPREGVAKSASLTDLDLSENDLATGKAVGEVLRVNTVLKTLDLSVNGLGEVGGKAVGEALGVNTVLQTLDLSRTFFDPGAAGGIARPKPERERGRKRAGNRGRKKANI